MHRPHFRFRQNYRPTAEDGLSAFEQPTSLSDLDAIVPARSSDPAPSVDDLRRMMHNEPEVRQQLLNEIRQKLARGDYLTRIAAEESAGRLLDGGEMLPRTP
jgi:hypothetical protein